MIITDGWNRRLRLSDPPIPGGEPRVPDPDPDPDDPPPIDEPPVPIPVPPDPGPPPQHLLSRAGEKGWTTVGPSASTQPASTAWLRIVAQHARAARWRAVH
jgi:hypothetical protein